MALDGTAQAAWDGHSAAPAGRAHHHSGLPSVASALAAQGSVARKWSGKKVRRVDGSGLSAIAVLPVECVVHIFAHLEPRALAVSQRVCRDWHELILDQSCWRLAFETFYLRHEPTLARRLHPDSWRDEYTARFNLLTRWAKSRTTSLTYDPAVGPISTIRLVPPPPVLRTTTAHTPVPAAITLLVVAGSTGLARKSNPFTGIAVRNSTTLDASPTDNLGQAIAQFPLMLSTAVGSNGSKIVWGMEDGSLRVNTVSNASLTERAWGGPGIRLIETAHGREVTAIAFGKDARGKDLYAEEADCFASVAADKVVVWTLHQPSLATPVGGIASLSAQQRAQLPRPRDQPVARLLWSAPLPLSLPDRVSTLASTTPAPYPTTLCFNLSRTSGETAIAVGMSDGIVHVWAGLNLAVAGRSLAERHWTLPAPSFNPVMHLFLDPHPFTPSLLVHHHSEHSFSRYHLSSDEPVRTLFGAKTDHIGELTAFACDFGDAELRTTTGEEEELEGTSDGAFGSRKFVVVGDLQGRTFLFDWSAPVPTDKDTMLEPNSRLQGFSSKVTSLALGHGVVFVGGLDGALRAYDPLTTALLRVFKDRAAPERMLSRMPVTAFEAEEERWRVSDILPGKDSVVFAVGGRIVSWKFREEVKQKKTGKSGGRGSIKSERVHSEYSLRREVEESITSLSTISAARVERLGNERRINMEYGLLSSLDQMTESEAVELALLLSTEDEEARWLREIEESSWTVSTSSSSPATEAKGETGEDLDLDEFDLDHSSSAGTGSYDRSLTIPSLSSPRGTTTGVGPSSSSLRSTSGLWRPSSQHSSPSLTAYHPHSYDSGGSNHKLQLSPRLGPTYLEVNGRESSPVPDFSNDYWPIASSTSPTPTASAPPSPSPSSNFPPAPVLRGWNQVARSASGSASPSPSISRIASSSSSLLAVSLGRGSTGLSESEKSRREREEEEEIHFAIQLSLAEDLSRLDLARD